MEILFRGRMAYKATKPGINFLGLLVVHFFLLVNACFCCVRFCFSIPSQEIGLGNVSEMTYFVLSGSEYVK